MKYWMFDGQQPQGPYEAEELKKLQGFTPETLICPEGTESPDQWKPAQYYLIRPPGSKSERNEPAPSPKPLKAAQSPAKAEPAADSAQPEPEKAVKPGPSTVTPRGSIGLPRWSSSTWAAVFIALFGVGMGYYITRRPSPSRDLPRQDGPLAASSEPASPVETPAQPSPQELALEQGRQRSIDSARAFPLPRPGPRMPSNAADALSPSRWSAPKSLGEYYERRALAALAVSASQALDKQGRKIKDGESEILKDKEKWAVLGRRFLKANHRLAWEADAVSGSTEIYRVSVKARYWRGAPEEDRSFQVDLREQTIKPLDFNSWHDLDALKASRWGGKNLRLAEALEGMAIEAPAYRLWAKAPIAGRPMPKPASNRPAPRTRRERARGAMPAEPAPSQAEAEPSTASSEAQEEPAPIAAPQKTPPSAAPAKPAPSAAPAKPAPSAAQSPEPTPTAAIPTSAPPRPMPAPQAVAAPKPASEPKSTAGENEKSGRKSVSEMSLDELQSYLKGSR
ncbi:MAG: hypothetical protein HY549_04295 [Elusimicrobia bacterium]|nr:hypothetical protein [Elusimicrobiota bacterium]